MTESTQNPGDSGMERRVNQLVEVCANFEQALKKLPPEKAQRYRDAQHQVAECRRRAATNRDILDMRLR